MIDLRWVRISSPLLTQHAKYWYYSEKKVGLLVLVTLRVRKLKYAYLVFQTMSVNAETFEHALRGHAPKRRKCKKIVVRGHRSEVLMGSLFQLSYHFVQNRIIVGFFAPK